MIPLIKINIKLLLRNKIFLFFLIITPILSAVILNLKVDYSVFRDNADVRSIIELDACTNKAVYLGDKSTYIIKVYDASRTELSEYILENLLKTGMFSVCRSDVREMTEEEVIEQAKKDAFYDRAGALLYLKENFDECVLNNDWDKGMQIYVVSEDERKAIFKAELTDIIELINQVQTVYGKDGGKIIEMLDLIESKMPEKKVINFVGKDDIELTQAQSNQKAQIGYAFAFIILGFLFCGVYLAHTVIKEQENKVYKRVMLTKVGRREYFASKFVVVLIITIMQSLVLAVCLSVMKNIGLGMDIFSFLLVIFLLGLIFSTLSFMLGTLLGDIMSSNYAVFVIWNISSLLAGVYFPLKNETPILKALSQLMPQRWFLNASEMLIVGDKGAYSMLLYVSVAYLVVIISMGSIGLKIKNYEE